MLSRLFIVFLPRSKCLLISWLQSPYAVFLESKKIVCHCFYCFPIYLPWNDGTRCHDLQFLNVRFKPAFSLSSFTFIKRLFSSSLLSAIRVVSSAYLRLLIVLQQSWFQCVLHPAQYFPLMSNKQGDNIQPWCTPFPIWNQSVPCPVPSVASWPTYRSLRR